MIILIILYALFCLGLFRFAFKRSKNTVFNPQKPHLAPSTKPYLKLFEEGFQWAIGQDHKEVCIYSQDSIALHGNLYSQDNAKAIILCVHGFRSSGIKDYSYVAKEFFNKGYNVLMIDQRAHGQSGGQYLTFGIKERFDIVSWCQYLGSQFDLPIFLDGVSMGAATVLMASDLSLDEHVKGIIADCGYDDPWHICQHFLTKGHKIPVTFTMNLINKVLEKKAKCSLKEASPLTSLSHSHLPVIFIHGLDDHFVPSYMSKNNYQVLNSPKELIFVEGASHGMSYFVDKEKCDQAVIKFIEKNM